MNGLFAAPMATLVAGAAGVAVGGWLLGLFGWHVVRRLMDRPRVPLNQATYIALGAVCVGALAVGLSGIWTALVTRDYVQADGETARIGQLRCLPSADGHARALLSPAGGLAPGEAPETYQVGGPGCPVAAEFARLRGIPSLLGTPSLARVARVGSDERSAQSPRWMLPPAAASAGPLMAFVQETREHAAIAPADEKATYELVASPEGLRVEAVTR